MLDDLEHIGSEVTSTSKSELRHGLFFDKTTGTCVTSVAKLMVVVSAKYSLICDAGAIFNGPS